MYLGIEIGGTKLQIAVGRGEGEPFRAIWRGTIEASQRAARIQQHQPARPGWAVAFT